MALPVRVLGAIDDDVTLCMGTSGIIREMWAPA